jgi:hypothetical protein
MYVTKQKINMSFTVGSLLSRESLQLLVLYEKYQDWTKAKKEAVETNILQTTKVSSCQRIVTELYSRLKLLNKKEIDLLTNGSSIDQLLILWLALCRKYQFIYTFAAEVLRNKLIKFDFQLVDSDFDLFFASRELIYPELESISEKQRIRLRQVLFRSIKEANIVDKNKQIKQFIASKELIEAINKNDLVIYPLIN